MDAGEHDLICSAQCRDKTLNKESDGGRVQAISEHQNLLRFTLFSRAHQSVFLSDWGCQQLFFFVGALICCPHHEPYAKKYSGSVCRYA